MNIVHVPHAYSPVIGGVETICKMLSETLQQQGHGVSVLTGNVASVQDYYVSDDAVDAPEEEVIEGVRVIRITYVSLLWRVALRLWQSSASQSVFRRLSNRLINRVQHRFKRGIQSHIARISPDVVLTMPHLVINVEAVLAAKRTLGFPLVMMPLLHEHDQNWEPESMKHALRHADSVIALTAFEADRLNTYYNVERERIFVIPPGVSLTNQQDDLAQRSPPNNILYLGRMVTTKGLDELISAMQKVWKTDPDVTLTLAGVRVDESTEIDALIEALPDHFRKRVIQHHNITEQMKKTLLSDALCLVLPSRIESFGLVLLEAWSEGVPVISWDLPVFSELIRHGEDGLLAPVDDVDLSRSILTLLNDPHAAQQMGLAGHSKVSQMYNWEQISAQYIQAYQAAIANAR